MDDFDGEINFKFYDFGVWGVFSGELFGIGGLVYLVNF